MIAVQEIVDRINSALDAEGSDRYLFDLDFRPAINYSIEWITTVGQRAFGTTKLSGENFRELTKVRVFQPSQYSRIAFDDNIVGDKLWTINRVIPEAAVIPDNAILTPRVKAEDTIFRGDLSFRDSDHSARRLTQEEWDENRLNIFEAGNVTLTNKFKTYAYLNFADYNSSSYNATSKEVEIRPDVSEQFVALSYTKKANPVSVIGDNIEFPETLTNLILEKALNFIAKKQGDQTNLWAISAQDVNVLAQLLS